MSLTRRTLMLAPAALAPLAAAAQEARAPIGLGERAAGPESAPVTVIEYFSLTCSHCATFHRDTWPQVKKELVEAGKMRMVWRDFPLDQLALAAAQVARALPAERYEGFIGALLASQDRWAFARGADNVAEIARIAALAGLSRAQVDAAIADEGLRRAILEGRLKAEQEHKVASTPTFVFGTRTVPGSMPFDRFAQLVGEASGA
ncbi:disulfide bond formation protein DsbA [Pseudoroseomonas rhizosphaerae]|uniref:Disulfide bond formation protein DsbA n=1 Tax=Teichococcus rhizosphaerae TaxID=1335062 RepID=A0A2C7A953_9PROT|nr:thioredoxin domain-containing protein [Pseudoroseomonas rhizosphaerae]PHK93584.1 disulfide bond formation protein DsbA [Pseudoroseomonas rhizosphaerae]